VKGASRYLYKAITDDWTDDDFDAHRDKESEKQLREEQRRQKELEQAYDAYRTELRSNYLEQMTDLEREDFDAEVERRAQEQVTEERKWMLGALRLMEKERMLDEAVDLPSFVDWCEAREYEQAQLDLF
jgi:hypothetical protein